MIKADAGFTLVEALLSLAIVGVLAGLSLPVYASLQTRNDLDLTTQSLSEMLRRGQVYARAVNGDSQWGVEIQSTSATLYKGASYAARDSSYDETLSIPASIAISGLSQVTFSRFSALPSTSGSITLSLDSDNQRTISLNAKGMVDY